MVLCQQKNLQTNYSFLITFSSTGVDCARESMTLLSLLAKIDLFNQSVVIRGSGRGIEDLERGWFGVSGEGL